MLPPKNWVGTIYRWKSHWVGLNVGRKHLVLRTFRSQLLMYTCLSVRLRIHLQAASGQSFMRTLSRNIGGKVGAALGTKPPAVPSQMKSVIPTYFAIDNYFDQQYQNSEAPDFNAQVQVGFLPAWLPTRALFSFFLSFGFWNVEDQTGTLAWWKVLSNLSKNADDERVDKLKGKERQN